MTDRPDILFLTHRVPYPPDRGDRIRSLNLLKFLAPRARVHLACLADEPLQDESRRQLQSLCEQTAVFDVAPRGRWLRAALSLAAGRSATEGLFASAPLQRTISDWSRRISFHAVLSFCSSMYSYGRQCSEAASTLVVDLVDVDSQKFIEYAARAAWWKRWLYRMEARRVRRLEALIAETADAVTLVSKEEVGVLRGFCRGGNVFAVSNGVDTRFFHPSAEGPRPESKFGGPRLVFVGVLDYGANVEGLRWFCRDVWPHLKRRLPSATLELVGKRPNDALRKLACTDGVELVGEVDDVRPYVWRADAVIAPLTIARGIQNKVLEALAMEKPVLATPQAIEGLAARSGEHLLAPRTPAEWIGCLERLVGEPEEGRRLAAAGRRLVHCQYAWDARLAPFAELLRLEIAPEKSPLRRDAVPAGECIA